MLALSYNGPYTRSMHLLIPIFIYGTTRGRLETHAARSDSL